MTFSPELIAALHRLGFAVMDDNKYAEVGVVQRADDAMVNGAAFTFKLKPGAFINKAHSDEG